MEGREHVHTGIIAVLFAGVSAILVIQLTRFVAAKLIDAGYDGAGSTLGAVVNFG